MGRGHQAAAKGTRRLTRAAQRWLGASLAVLGLLGCWACVMGWRTEHRIAADSARQALFRAGRCTVLAAHVTEPRGGRSTLQVRFALALAGRRYTSARWNLASVDPDLPAAEAQRLARSEYAPGANHACWYDPAAPSHLYLHNDAVHHAHTPDSGLLGLAGLLALLVPVGVRFLRSERGIYLPAK
jgi:ABC-type nickel/cobalt efflux system permease component RcnA